MNVQIILLYGNEEIETYYLKRREDIKQILPGLIEFETKEPGHKKGKERTRTIIYYGSYSVSFIS